MNLIQELHEAGVELSTFRGKLIAGPESALTPIARLLIAEFNAELYDAVHEVELQVAEALKFRDTRVRCLDCKHHHSYEKRCANHRAAGLMHGEVGAALAAMRQHCPGFVAKAHPAAEKPATARLTRPEGVSATTTAAPRGTKAKS